METQFRKFLYFIAREFPSKGVQESIYGKRCDSSNFLKQLCKIFKVRIYRIPVANENCPSGLNALSKDIHESFGLNFNLVCTQNFGPHPCVEGTKRTAIPGASMAISDIEREILIRGNYGNWTSIC